jgi:hypothetical protein
MKTHLLVDDEKESIVLSLLRQVGSVHDNIAFVESIPSELTNNQITLHPPDNFNSQAISILFHEINYHIDQKTKGCKSKPRKQILYNISGGFSPGMNAILGKYIIRIFLSIYLIFFQDHQDVGNHLY